MTGTPPCPQVYRAINRITAAFAADGIAKTRVNLVDQYQYRSIDDVLNRLAPLLTRHRLCVLPRVVGRDEQAVRGDFDTVLASVRLEVEFDLVSARDGSRHTVRAWGEALDASDKGTAKAMSAAFKAAMIQVFCIPVSNDDADRTRHRRRGSHAEPVEGWACWCDALERQISNCDSKAALDRLTSDNSSLLQSLQRDQAERYRWVGERFTARLQDLGQPGRPTVSPTDIAVDA